MSSKNNVSYWGEWAKVGISGGMGADWRYFELREVLGRVAII